MTDLSLVTLTPQQLSYATAMVRWPTASCRDVIDYLRAHTIDDPDLPEGEPIALAVSPAQLAANIGVSANTIRGAFAKLVAARVVVQLQPAAGSVPPVWFLSGDLPRWKVKWRVDPALAISKVASLISYAPYGGQQTRITCAPHGGQKSALTITISCLAIVHRGPFATRYRPRKNDFGSYAHRTAQLIGESTPAFSFSLVPSEPSTSKSQEEEVAIAPQTQAVLAAIATVAGQPVWDSPKHRPKARVIEAVTPLADTSFIVSEVLRRGRMPWMQAVELVELLAATGPAKPAPRTGPGEFVSDETDTPADPAAASAALEAAKSALGPPAKWEDVG